MKKQFSLLLVLMLLCLPLLASAQDSSAEQLLELQRRQDALRQKIEGVDLRIYATGQYRVINLDGVVDKATDEDGVALSDKIEQLFEPGVVVSFKRNEIFGQFQMGGPQFRELFMGAKFPDKELILGTYRAQFTPFTLYWNPTRQPQAEVFKLDDRYANEYSIETTKVVLQGLNWKSQLGDNSGVQILAAQLDKYPFQYLLATRLNTGGAWGKFGLNWVHGIDKTSKTPFTYNNLLGLDWRLGLRTLDFTGEYARSEYKRGESIYQPLVDDAYRLGLGYKDVLKFEQIFVGPHYRALLAQGGPAWMPSSTSPEPVADHNNIFAYGDATPNREGYRLTVNAPVKGDGKNLKGGNLGFNYNSFQEVFPVAGQGTPLTDEYGITEYYQSKRQFSKSSFTASALLKKGKVWLHWGEEKITRKAEENGEERAINLTRQIAGVGYEYPLSGQIAVLAGYKMTNEKGILPAEYYTQKLASSVGLKYNLASDAWVLLNYKVIDSMSPQRVLDNYSANILAGSFSFAF
jgi:hypothetical protein